MTDILLRTRLDGSAQVKQGLGQINQSLDELNTRAVAIGATIGTVLGQAIVGWVQQLAGQVQSAIADFANLGERFDKLRAQTDLSVRTLSQLDYVARNNSMSVESLAVGFRTFARQVDAANDGSKRALKLFQDLGISQRELRELSAEDIWKASVQAIGRMSDGIERAALSTRLFGISWRNIAVVADQLEEGAKQADAIGFSMDERAHKAAQRLDDQLDKLNRRIEAFWRGVAQDLAPVLTDAVTVFDSLSPAMDRVTAGSALLAEALDNIPWLRVQAEALRYLGTLRELGKEEEKASRERRTSGGRIGEAVPGTAALEEALDRIAEKTATPRTKQFKEAEGMLIELDEAVRKLGANVSSEQIERINLARQALFAMGEAREKATKAHGGGEDAAHAAFVLNLETESRLMKQVEQELKGLAEAREKAWREQEEQMRAAAGAEVADVQAKIRQREAYEDLADPMRVFARQLELIDELQSRYGLSAGAAAEATRRAAEDMARSSDKIKERSPWDELLREVQGFGRQFTDRLYDITRGAEDAFGKLLESIGEMFSKRVLHEFITKPFEDALTELINMVRQKQGEMGGGISGFLGAAGSVLGKGLGSMFDFSNAETVTGGGYFGGIDLPPMQFGGYIPPGYSTMVGEAGTEIVTAGRAGATVTPVARGDTYNFAWHIAAGVTRAELTALVPKLKADTLAAVYDARRRGGRFAP